jgi:hypothetical protein
MGPCGQAWHGSRSAPQRWDTEVPTFQGWGPARDPVGLLLLLAVGRWAAVALAALGHLSARVQGSSAGCCCCRWPWHCAVVAPTALEHLGAASKGVHSAAAAGRWALFRVGLTLTLLRWDTWVSTSKHPHGVAAAAGMALCCGDSCCTGTRECLLRWYSGCCCCCWPVGAVPRWLLLHWGTWVVRFQQCAVCCCCCCFARMLRKVPCMVQV